MNKPKKPRYGAADGITVWQDEQEYKRLYTLWKKEQTAKKAAKKERKQ